MYFQPESHNCFRGCRKLNRIILFYPSLMYSKYIVGQVFTEYSRPNSCSIFGWVLFYELFLCSQYWVIACSYPYTECHTIIHTTLKFQRASLIEWKFWFCYEHMVCNRMRVNKDFIWKCRECSNTEGHPFIIAFNKGWDSL